MLADKYGLEREIMRSSGYTQPVDIQGPAFRQVERVIRDTALDLPVCPNVMTGTTDASVYQVICRSDIRFAPVVVGPEQMKGMHAPTRPWGRTVCPEWWTFMKTALCSGGTVCSEQTGPFI